MYYYQILKNKKYHKIGNLYVHRVSKFSIETINYKQWHSECRLLPSKKKNVIYQRLIKIKTLQAPGSSDVMS